MNVTQKSQERSNSEFGTFLIAVGTDQTVSKWFLMPVALFFLFVCAVLGEVVVSEFKILTRPFSNVGVLISIGMILVLGGFATYLIYAAFNPKKIGGVQFFQNGLIIGNSGSFTNYSDLEHLSCSVMTADEVARERKYFQTRLMISIFAMNPAGIAYARTKLNAKPPYSTAVIGRHGEKEIRLPLQFNEHAKLLGIFQS